VLFWRANGLEPHRYEPLPYTFTDHVARSVRFGNEPALDLVRRDRSPGAA
jgi:hypothetical protein